MAAESIVEGEWKSFVFKMIEKEDWDKVLENMGQVFFNDEPMMASMGTSKTPEMKEDFLKFAAHALDNNDRLSFCALDKDTGKIAAVRITYISKADDPHEPPFERKSERIGALIQNLVELTVEADVTKVYGVSEYAELIMTSVNPEFRGQGLVTEIYRRSIALLKSRGIPLCKSTFTSPFTQRVALKFGFKEHARRDFLAFKDSNGDQVLPDAQPGQVAVLMALKLN